MESYLESYQERQNTIPNVCVCSFQSWVKLQPLRLMVENIQI